MKTLSSIIIITFFSAAVFAQEIKLDSTFGVNGKATAFVGSSLAGCNSVALQTDGKIIVAGFSSSPFLFTLIRFKSNGIVDSAFGNNGIVTTSFDSAYVNSAASVVIQLDGKILVAGALHPPGSNYYVYFGLARYNPDGSLDSTFGSNGLVKMNFGQLGAAALSMVLQADGKIVLGGSSSSNTDGDFAIARFNTDGTLDNSFDGDGKVTTSFISNGTDACYSLAIQPDGKIVAAGISYYYGSGYHAFALARYNTDGSLDSAFGSGGKVAFSFGGSQDGATSIVLQTDGKMIVAGNVVFGINQFDYAVSRLNIDGSLDSTFGFFGKVVTDIADTFDKTGKIILQPDGKILLAGLSVADSINRYTVVRYNINGSLDSTFDYDGIVITYFNGYNAAGRDLLLQEDGKIVVGGIVHNITGWYYGLVRYLPSLDLGQIDFPSPQSSPLIYPNPIHQTETLEYTLTKNESLTIALYDVNGKLIRNFISNEQRTAGANKETLNIGALPAGSYFLTLSNGEQKMTVKMVKQ